MGKDWVYYYLQNNYSGSPCTCRKQNPKILNPETLNLIGSPEAESGMEIARQTLL